MDKLYPTAMYVVIQIVLLLLGILPGVLFFIWRILASQ